MNNNKILKKRMFVLSLIVVILLLSILAYSVDEQKARQDELEKIKKLVIDERTNTFSKAVARIKSLQKTEGKSKETIARHSKEADALLNALTEENKREGFDKYDLAELEVSSTGTGGSGTGAAKKTAATDKDAEPAAKWYTKWYYWVGIVFLLLMIVNVSWKRKESMTWRGVKGIGGFGKDTAGMLWSKVPGVGKRRERIKKAAEKYLEAVGAKEQKILEKSLLITSSIKYKEKVILININETNRLISLSKDLGKIVKSHLLVLTDPDIKKRKAVDVKGVGIIKPIIILKCLDALKEINNKIRKDLDELNIKLTELKGENNTSVINAEKQVISLKGRIESTGFDARFNNNSEILIKVKAANTELARRIAEIKTKITQADTGITELNGKITADIVLISTKQDLLIDQERSGYKSVRELIEKRTIEYVAAAQNLILRLAIALKDKFVEEDKKFYEEFKAKNTEINTLLTQVGTEVAGVIELNGNALELWKVCIRIIRIRDELTKSPPTIVIVNAGNKEINYKEFGKIITRLKDAEERAEDSEIELDKEFKDLLEHVFINFENTHLFEIINVEKNSITLKYTYADGLTYPEIRLEWNQLVNFEVSMRNLVREIDNNLNRINNLQKIKVEISTKKTNSKTTPLTADAFKADIVDKIAEVKSADPNIKLENFKDELVGLQIIHDNMKYEISRVEGDSVFLKPI